MGGIDGDGPMRWMGQHANYALVVFWATGYRPTAIYAWECMEGPWACLMSILKINWFMMWRNHVHWDSHWLFCWWHATEQYDRSEETQHLCGGRMLFERGWRGSLWNTLLPDYVALEHGHAQEPSLIMNRPCYLHIYVLVNVLLCFVTKHQQAQPGRRSRVPWGIPMVNRPEGELTPITMVNSSSQYCKWGCTSKRGIDPLVLQSYLLRKGLDPKGQPQVQSDEVLGALGRGHSWTATPSTPMAWSQPGCGVPEIQGGAKKEVVSVVAGGI